MRSSNISSPASCRPRAATAIASTRRMEFIDARETTTGSRLPVRPTINGGVSRARWGWRTLADDSRFAGTSARKANEDALDAELSSALAPLNAEDCAARLRDAGVLAAPVNPAPAVIADPQLQSREYFVAIDRAVVGT